MWSEERGVQTHAKCGDDTGGTRPYSVVTLFSGFLCLLVLADVPFVDVVRLL